MFSRRTFAMLPAAVLVLTLAVQLTTTLPIVERFDEDTETICFTAESFRVKVAAGKEPAGKRYFVARVNELPLSSAYVLSSDAVASAVSAAIAAATAPILDRDDAVNTDEDPNIEENGFDNVNAGGADANDEDSDEAFGLKTVRDDDNDNTENDGIVCDDPYNFMCVYPFRESDVTARESVLDISTLATGSGEDGAETENNGDTLMTRNDGRYSPAGLIFSNVKAYTSLDGATNSPDADTVFENAFNFNTGDVMVGDADNTDATLQYIEVEVDIACDENGNRRILTTVLSTPSPTPDENAGAPAPSASPPVSASGEDDAVMLDDCPEEWRDVEWRDEKGNSALHLAANTSLVECLNALIAAGADLEARNTEGETALFLASRYENVVSAGRLIDEGADKEAPIHGGWRPLHCAARNGLVTIVELLLQAGVDVDVRSDDGTTPLWVAAYYNRADTAQLLLRSGADMNFAASNGITPKGAAFWRNSMDVIEIFLNENTEDNINNNWDENYSSDSDWPLPHRFSLSNQHSETIRGRKEPAGFVPSSYRSSGHHRSMHYPELRRKALD